MIPAAFTDAMSAACARFAINTPARVAGFTAQCRVESNEFTSLTEDLFYTHPERIVAVFPREVPTLALAQPLVGNPRLLAGAVYSNRNGNGPQGTGDGWNYRGRGLVQLTGRADYMTAAAALNRPYVDQPDLVALPADACLVAAWYWQSNGCNELADAHNWDAITKAINGAAMLQAARRAQLSNDILNGVSA